MFSSRQWIVTALAALVVAACVDGGPTAPRDAPFEVGIVKTAGGTVPQSSAAGIPDVSGDWVFSETISVLQPSELNPVIGAPASDRPMTRVDCDAEGTASITQVGDEFEGTATQSVVCRVGVVSFVPPEFAFNPEFFILNGRIEGRSAHFDTGHTLSTCPNRGSLEVYGGVARGMSIVGDCPVPFHPGEHHSQWSFHRP